MPRVPVFILEHPTKGVLKDWDAGTLPSDPAWVFKWSWSGMRGEEGKCYLFFHLREAQEVRDKMPLTLRVQVKILSSALEWREVSPLGVS